MASLVEGDSARLKRLYGKLKMFGPIVSVLAYLAGLVYFCSLSHQDVVHGTYISENALMPGLVTSDVYSSEIINTYFQLLESHYKKKKNTFDMKFIHELFVQHAKVESYIQTFNVTNPFYDPEPNTEHVKSGRNVYTYVRSQRGDGTESIVISAPAYVNAGSNRQVPNFLGIAELFAMVDLAKNKPYWAKDMIFVVTEQSNYGMQAWVNSYYDIKSEYISAEGLKRRGGSIQAALNLEFPDIYINKLELKLEGANGKLPNLDLFNSIIHICATTEIQCSLESEKGQLDHFHNHYNKRNKAPIELMDGIENTVNMVFKQATGMPSSLHGYFLNHRIEALTITGVKSPTGSKGNAKQNLVRATRVIESTLRSINNLLERFHQSFFFYLLPSSHHYISIGMYMPAFGLVALPLLIKILNLWFSVFFDTDAESTTEKEPDNQDTNLVEILSRVLPNLIIPALFGFLLYLGSPYFIFIGKKLNLTPKDSIIACYIFVFAQIILMPSFYKSSSSSIRTTTISNKLTKFFVILALIIFLGTLSLLNFSLAFLLAIFYVPISQLATQNIQNKLLKLIQLLSIILATPLLYFTLLYIVYSYMNQNLNSTDPVILYKTLSEKFYKFTFISKICNIWTPDLINLGLIPIWSALWLIASSN